MKTNIIYNENCIETLERMEDKCIDLVVTSPPYDNLRDYDGFEWDFPSMAKQLFRVIKDGGVVVWVVGDATIKGSETLSSFKQAIYFNEIGFNVHDTMIWQKRCPPVNANRYEPSFEYMFVLSKGKPKTFNGVREKRKWIDNRSNKQFQRTSDKKTYKSYETKYGDVLMTNVWEIHNRDSSEHPAIFPEALVGRHISTWSNKGDIVYDPFMGSGTTAIMALKSGRKFIGSEISSKYCELAENRLDPILNQGDLFS